MEYNKYNTDDKALNDAMKEIGEISAYFNKRIIECSQKHFKCDDGFSIYSLRENGSIQLMSICTKLIMEQYSSQFMKLILSQITGWFDGLPSNIILTHIDSLREEILKNSIIKNQ